jgi:localization factor PodJL
MGRYGEAVQGWLQAAQTGDAEAQYRLSQCLARGIGISRDMPQAATWLTKAAEGGHPRAAFDLAMSQDRKDGDRAAFIKWIKIAAERGVPEAQYNLATLLEEGDKLPRDLIESYVWYRVAAETFRSTVDNEHLDRIGAQLSHQDIIKAERRAAELIGKFTARR